MSVSQIWHSRFWVVLAVILVGALCLFVAYPGRMLFDTMFHLGRVDALAAHFLAGGGYPCRLYADSCAGLGYAAPLFYGDLFLIPVALLRACGASLDVCFGAVLAEGAALSFAVMYGACAWFGLRARERLACACFFLFAPSTMMMAFSYGQVGMAFATAFLPCVVFPTLVLVTESGASARRLWEAAFLLALGMTACVLSHVITTVLAVLFVGALCLARLPIFFREPRRLACFAAAAFATLGVTAWFWVPMLEQWAAVDLLAFSSVRWTAAKGLFAGGPSVFGLLGDSFVWGLGLTPLLVDFCPEGWTWLPALLQVNYDTFAVWGWLLAPLVWLLFRTGVLSRFGASPPWVRVAGWALLLLTLLAATPLALGVLAPLFGWIQFPSRFFGLWTCLLAPLVACFAFRRCTASQRCLLGIAFLAAFLMVCVWPFNCRRVVLMELFPSVSGSAYSIGRGEYLPERFVRTFGVQPPPPEEEVVPWEWRGVAAWGSGPFALDVVDPRSSVVVPRFYYKGYAATLDGAPILIRESGEGFVEAETAGRMGQLRVWYAGTALQRASVWLSVAASIAVALLFLLARRRLRCFRA